MIRLTQYEIEKKIAEPLTHGMLEDIARGTGTYPKTINKYFNAHDERQSPYFRVLAMQAVIDEKDREVGDEVWSRMCSMREASRPSRGDVRVMCADHELGSLSKEFSDVIVAKCEGRPVVDQLKEIHEARLALDRYEQAVKSPIVELNRGDAETRRFKKA